MENINQELMDKQEIVPIVTEIKDIERLVYVIRGKQVMLDSVWLCFIRWRQRI